MEGERGQGNEGNEGDWGGGGPGHRVHALLCQGSVLFARVRQFESARPRPALIHRARRRAGEKRRAQGLFVALRLGKRSGFSLGPLRAAATPSSCRRRASENAHCAPELLQMSAICTFFLFNPRAPLAPAKLLFPFFEVSAHAVSNIESRCFFLFLCLGKPLKQHCLILEQGWADFLTYGQQ